MKVVRTDMRMEVRVEVVWTYVGVRVAWTYMGVRVAWTYMGVRVAWTYMWVKVALAYMRVPQPCLPLMWTCQPSPKTACTPSRWV